MLTYFPTEECWTLVARPERIPLEDRFPNKYLIGLPQIPKTSKPCPAPAPDRRNKKDTAGKDLGTQGTLDSFMEVQPKNKQVHFAEDDQNNMEEDQEVDTLIKSLLWSD